MLSSQELLAEAGAEIVRAHRMLVLVERAMARPLTTDERRRVLHAGLHQPDAVAGIYLELVDRGGG